MVYSTPSLFSAFLNLLDLGLLASLWDFLYSVFHICVQRSAVSQKLPQARGVLVCHWAPIAWSTRTCYTNLASRKACRVFLRLAARSLWGGGAHGAECNQLKLQALCHSAPTWEKTAPEGVVEALAVEVCVRADGDLRQQAYFCSWTTAQTP